jgi:hypothetical protein
MFIATMANKVQPLQTQRLTLFQQAHHGSWKGKRLKPDEGPFRMPAI